MTTDVTSAARKTMAKLHRAPEPDVLKPMIERARLDSSERKRIVTRAESLIKDIREAQHRSWVAQFLNEYQLSSQEGLALMTLAEAYLRVPDATTSDLLISDKLGDADWRSHSRSSNSRLVNSATFGLILGRVMVGEGDGAGGAIKKLVSRMGEPFVRQAVGAAMRLMGEVFVMGRTIEEAQKRMRKKENRDFTASFDMLGEAARTQADADAFYDSYMDAIQKVGREPDRDHTVSIKLSALHARYETSQYDKCIPEITERLAELCREAVRHDVAITVDAEEADRLDMSLDVIGAVGTMPEFRDWHRYGLAVQAYGKRSRAVIEWADSLGRPMNVRLVKGAYWDTEIKRTQVAGLEDYPVFTRKASTDTCYLACAKDMLEAKNIGSAFATHNALTVGTILDWAEERHGKNWRGFEFQRLHGMGEGLYDRLVHDEGYHCRIYAPVGGHKELLAYLVRRLLENGANSSFVNQLADDDYDDATLLADPVEKTAQVGGTMLPGIPLPIDIMENWKNSQGIDLGDRDTLLDTARKINEVPFEPEGVDSVHEDPHHPSGRSRAFIEATRTSNEDVHGAITAAQAAYPEWDLRPVEERAALLEKFADVLEENRIELMGLVVKEAFRSIPDALSEVREAADFCRYYAHRARIDMPSVRLPGPTGEYNAIKLEGRGTFATVSPWNFPLAIFVGQNAAALVTGNTVVAKPAPQTPTIARRVVELAHQCGIPEDAWKVVTGGADVGAELMADTRIAGVAFTGSIGTAKRIASTLLVDEDRPIIPFIAETGGVNAMIVDSTALPEQVAADVMASAFQSAGQRCSALRLLILQEDVADEMIAMLSGAMDMLYLGDPGDPATDVGPVIDRDAYDKLMSYRETMRPRWIKTVEAPSEGLFVPPTMISIDEIEDLNKEWFGPLIHVATWKAGRLKETVQRVNAKGYGLTMGLHSRVQKSADVLQTWARVGNIYINRSQIGAVVGSQPFGGEGLSGTGPKAGGPHYLPRFCAERAVSIDTTSAGGNASLLSLDTGEV